MQEQVVIKSENSIILTAPVMIPNRPDCDYTRGEKLFTAEEIKAFKEEFDDYGFVDKYHTIRSQGSADKNELIGHALKSFLLTEPTDYMWNDGTVHTYPPGTWMLTSEITNPNAIKHVNEGLINGYSPSIFSRQQAEQIKAALKASEGGLVKDINDPVTALVSLVYKPCQQGNKFCKNINVGENMSNDKAQSKLNAIMNILGGKDPEYALKEDLDALKEEISSAFKSDEFKGLLQDTVNNCIVEALKDPSLKSEGENKPPKDDETEGEENSPKEDEKSPEDEEEGTEEEKPKENPATKGDSKGLPQHEGNKPALKSDKAVVMGMMGRTLNGRPKKQ